MAKKIKDKVEVPKLKEEVEKCNKPKMSLARKIYLRKKRRLALLANQK